MEPKYSFPAPPDWEMNETTEIHAKKIEETSPKWTGRVVSPTKDQLYWYEIKRSAAEADDKLKKFLEEFGAIDDDECFQFGGTSIFGTQMIQRTQERARALAALVEILPMRDLR